MPLPEIEKSQVLQHLQAEIKRSTSWFYWIGALSAINSLAIAFSAGFGFLIGLGITQFIDGFTYGFIENGAPEFVRFIGLAISLFISALCALFAIAGNKRVLSVYIIGMVIYAMDSLIFLAFQDWLPFGFHIFALFGLSKAVGNIKKYRDFESMTPEEIDIIGDDEPL